MKLFRRLAVLESEWFSGYSHSVRPVFEFLSHDVADRTDNFRYERFVGRESFFETLHHAARQRDTRYIYIACHGSDDALHFPNGTQISVAELAETIERMNQGTQIDGLFLGSCLIGTAETAQRLLTSRVAAPQRIKWVAGYTDSVAWFDATLLDVLFLRSLLLVGTEETPRRSVEIAIKTVTSHMAGLASTSKFGVYVRTQRSGEISNIVTHQK